MGIATAIIGSALIGAGSSAYGAKQANKASKRNARRADENIDLANQAVRGAVEPANIARQRGADIYSGALGRGTNFLTQGYREGQQAVDERLGNYTDANWLNQNFFASPDYNFRQQEGLNAVQNSAAAGGAGLYSGNTLRGITDYSSNLAAGEYGDWFNRSYGVDSTLAQNDYQSIMGQANAMYGGEVGAGQAQADVQGQYANSLINAGNTVAGNYTQNANIQAQTPYYSPYGGINNALQGGVQNWMWAKSAGMFDPKTQPQTTPVQQPTAPAGYPIMY